MEDERKLGPHLGFNFAGDRIIPNPFSQSSNKYSLRIYYVPSTILDARDTIVRGNKYSHVFMKHKP